MGISHEPRWGQLALLIALFLAFRADAKTHRSHAAIAEFKRQQPCPSTGKPKGACPGWIIDHVDPLCHGGADAPSNMQWQTVENAKAKDRIERNMCKH